MDIIGSQRIDVMPSEGSVQDVRTQPWGYRAKEIIDYLTREEYGWFRLIEGGLVAELDVSPDEFEGNFVACPDEFASALRERGSTP